MLSKLQEWLGVLLMGVLLVATVWLGAVNKLQLYIHPRYKLFTLIMAGIGISLITLTLVMYKAPATLSKISRRQTIYSMLSIACCLVFIIIPPMALSSSTASQRGLNSTVVDSISSRRVNIQDTTDFRAFNIKEWSSLLATTDTTFFSGKPARISGFVYPGEDPDPSVFYIARFQVTCCAVDAQAKGVPVYIPDWQQKYRTDQWLSIDGAFAVQGQPARAIIIPTKITPIAQPENPYEY